MTEKKKQGFAAMDPARQAQVASKGGKAAQAKGATHRWTPEEAKAAGSKGARVARERGTAHRWTSDTAKVAAREARRRALLRRKLEAEDPAAELPADFLNDR